MAQTLMQEEQVDPKLAALQEVMAQTAATATENAAANRATMKDNTTLSGDLVNAINDLTSARTTISNVEEVELAKAQNKTIEAANASGGVDLQTELLAKMREGGKEIQDLLAKKSDIVDDEHVGLGLIDNIINGLRSSQLDRVIEAKRQEQLSTLGQVQAITAGTESVAREAALMMKTKNEATIAAKTKEIAAIGAIEAKKAELDTLQSNAQLMNQAMTSDLRSIDLLASAYRLDGEAEDRKLRAAQQESARKQLLEQDATKEQLVAAMQRGQKFAHGKDYQVEPAETLLYKLESGDAATKLKYNRYLDMGISTAIDPLGGILGSTPYEARKTMAVLDTSGTIPETKGTKILRQIEQQLVANYESVGKKLPTTDAEMQAAYDKLAATVMEGQAAEIKKSDKSNPYSAPSMATLSDSPAVQETVLWKKVLAPLGMKETDHEVLIDHAIANVANGSISPEDAITGITAIFKTAAVLNNTGDGGLRRVGLPSQTSYNIKLESPDRSAFNIVGDVAKAATLALPLALFPSLATPERTNPIAITKNLLIGSISSYNLMDEASVRFMVVRRLSATPKDIEGKGGSQ